MSQPILTAILDWSSWKEKDRDIKNIGHDFNNEQQADTDIDRYWWWKWYVVVVVVVVYGIIAWLPASPPVFIVIAVVFAGYIYSIVVI